MFVLCSRSENFPKVTQGQSLWEGILVLSSTFCGADCWASGPTASGELTEPASCSVGPHWPCSLLRAPKHAESSRQWGQRDATGRGVVHQPRCSLASSTSFPHTPIKHSLSAPRCSWKTETTQKQLSLCFLPAESIQSNKGDLPENPGLRT